MTDLQLSLLALGAVVIAAVILFNWWQEQRIRRETVRRFEGPIEDALLVDNYQAGSKSEIVDREYDVAAQQPIEQDRLEEEVEPAFSFEDIRAQAAELPSAETAVEEELGEDSDVTDPDTHYVAPLTQDSLVVQPIEEVIEQKPVEVEAAQSASVISSNLPPNMDEQIDLIAVITPAQPCTGEKLREAMLPLPQMDKPSLWLGMNADGLWRHFTKDQEQTQFSIVVGSLQLADRSGAVSAATLRDFQRKAEETASRLQADIHWRGPASPQHYAQELDQFCIEVDVMVSLHLIAGQHTPFAGTKLRGLAEAGGMSLQDDGMFHYVNDSNEMQFTLVNQSSTPFSVEMLRTALIQAVTLQLDVTRVTNCPEAFNKMAILARRMEQGLGAKLVDDNQRVLGDAEIEKIRQQLKKICATMTAHDITPGSPTALRLFS